MGERESKNGNARNIGEIDVLWVTAGLGCDGDTIAMTAATQPSIEDIVLGGIPWIPKVNFHNPFLAIANGDEFLKPLSSSGEREARAVHSGGRRLDSRTRPTSRRATGPRWEPIRHRAAHSDLRLDRSSGAARLGGGGCRNLRDLWRHSRHAGKSHRRDGACPIIWDGSGSRSADIPIVCVPGCPVQPDNMMETLLYLFYMAAGRAPMIPLDEQLRPTWLFGQTVHEGCDRGGYYEQAEFADEYGSPLCIVKLGCWGPVVQCNVGKRGWMGGIGGCPNVGGICIGCTMPGFPDKFMPFMNQPPGSLLSASAVQTYGKAIHALRRFTQASLNKEPSWRRRRDVPKSDKVIAVSRRSADGQK